MHAVDGGELFGGADSGSEHGEQYQERQQSGEDAGHRPVSFSTTTGPALSGMNVESRRARRDEGWPAVQRAAADVDRIGDDCGVVLETVADRAADQAAEQNEQGERGLAGADELVELLEREGGVGVDVPVPLGVRLAGGGDEAQTGTGLQFTALAGPTCPVEQPGDPACAPKPVPDVSIVIMDGNGTVMDRIVLNASGTEVFDVSSVTIES